MFLVCSGVCSGIVCDIDGRVVTSVACTHVQLAENCRDFVLQHGTYSPAVVSDLAGYWRTLQQGMLFVFVRFFCFYALRHLHYTFAFTEPEALFFPPVLSVHLCVHSSVCLQCFLLMSYMLQQSYSSIVF